MRKQTITLGGSLVAAVLLMQSNAAWAVPAFGRLFNEKCSTCHSPQPPQLNNFGYVFKRLGYRMLDTDENDKLIARAAEDQNIGNNLDVVAVLQAAEQSNASWTADLHEVEVLAHGTLGDNNEFAYGLEYTLQDEGGPGALEDGAVQWSTGTPDALITVKAGQFSPVLWRKVNAGRLTPSRAFLINNRINGASDAGGTATLPRLRERQQGVEFGYATNKNEDGVLSSTFFTAAITKGLMNGEGVLGSDNDSSKDYTLQIMHLYGDHNTVSVLWTTGTNRLATAGAGGTLTADEHDNWAILGNHAFGEEDNINLLYGAMKGNDDLVDTVAGTVSADSTSYFAEIDYTIRAAAEDVNPLTAIARYDWARGDTVTFPAATITTTTTKAITIGLAGQYSTNSLWSVEYMKTFNGGPHRLIGEVKLVF